jgi:5'-nucleotidase
MRKMAHILVTNDDGISAPGLLALVQALRGIAEVSVLAPDRNWSASGHVKTLHRPLRVKETLLADGSAALASDGAPSDCVALAVLGIVPKIDLVVSGINPHANIGHDVTYSGTVTAAMEAVIWGIPGLAVSLDSPEDHLGALDYAPAGEYARRVAEMILRKDLPQEVVLNLNVPYLPLDGIKGLQATRQGLRVYHDELLTRSDPRGVPYYWIGGAPPSGIPDQGTDFGALKTGFASLTPLHLDLTASDSLSALKESIAGK